MRAERVTLKRRTLLQLKFLLEDGQRVAALQIVNDALDVGKQTALQACKDEAYRRFRAGRFTYEQYREHWEMADDAMA